MTTNPSTPSLPALSGPYAGMLVLELCGDEPSGSLGTQILADLGATVLKLERPPSSDLGGYEPPPAGTDMTHDLAYFVGLNRNKASISLDLKQEEGRAILHALAARADVFYDNFKPGVTKRLGADAETLRAINPELVYCSVTGFGHTGPWSTLPAYDATIQAMGGGMSITGGNGPDDQPVRWGNPIGGIGGALYAVIAILSALRRRRTQGVGARIDIALLDAQLAMLSYRVPPALAGKVYRPDPHRGGSGALPYGPFLAGDDRWFVVGITSQFWPTFCRIIGRPEWENDARFKTEKLRQQNEAELNAAVTTIIGAQSADHWQAVFVEAGIPGVKVATIEEAFAHPHVALRNMLVGFAGDPVADRFRVAGNPIKLGNHPEQPFISPPGLGEHSEVVLRDFLKLPEAERADLRRKRAVWWPQHGRAFERDSIV